MSLLVIANITARPGCGDELKTALGELVTAVRTEPDCLLYELYQSTESPDRFIMHERWTNEAGLAAHNQMPHMAAFGQKAGTLLAGPAVLTKVQE